MRIETLELLTGDIDAQRVFYGERLALPVRGDEELRVSVGRSELVFRHEPGFRGIYHLAFDVPFGSLGAAETFLQQSGVAPLADNGGATRFTFESWAAEAVYFHDASGNIVEFIGRQEIGTEGSDFRVLSISELGVACADVLATAEKLGSGLGATGYRQTATDFFPLGDAEGLLILAQTGRKWYPDTGIPAQELPFWARLRTPTGRWAVAGEGSTLSVSSLA